MLPTRFRTSLIHRLFLSIWGLFLVLLLLLSLLGYVALRLATDSVTPMVLQRMVQLKAQTNEGLFLQADVSVRRLRMALLRRLEDVDARHGEQRFQELFARSADGLWRVRPELLDTERAPTLYLHAGDQGLSASARQRAVASYELLREQGPALTPPFFSAYMDFVEDGLMVFARGIDWGGNANAQSSNINYPTMLGADPRRNPDRKVFWTPVYLDEQAHTWMVSVIAPLDWKGRWVGTLGHDVAMASLIDSVTGGKADLGQQLILDGRGHLIAHPDWGERISAAQGQLSIAELQDQVLDELQQLMQQTPGDSGAGRIAAGRQWAAWSRIRGPNWYQVILLPQERVNRELRLGLAAVVGLGFLVLVPGLWWLRRRVRVLVARPLHRLTLAVDELGRGHDPIPIGLAGDNELGRLAAAFDTMAADLTQQRAMQAAHARTLQGEVDERRQVMQRLQQERARLLALLGAMHQGILFVDTEQQVSYCNATYRDLWRLPASLPIVGQPLAQLLPASLGQITMPERLTQYLQLQPGLADAAPLELLLKDGRTLLLAIHPVPDSQGGAMGCLWVCEDVTQQRQTAQQLITLAERDALTGLFNRRRFEQELERFFHESTRQPSPPHQAAVLFFDLDEFKYINDRFGHGAGDAVLLRVAGEVKGLVRDTDVLSRLGGDEFAIFMPHASLDSAQLLAERVVRAVASTALHIEGHNLRLTTSLGIAHFPLHASSAQELVAHADTAMYQAKHLGKNRFSVYHPDRDIAETMVARLAWNERIERALAGGLLRLHSQGVYHTQSGHLAHLEALVRMVDENDPTQLIGPGQFIAHAEKSGKILDIDRWVLRESIRLLAEHPGLPAMAVNISGRSIDDPELPGFITAQLAGQGVAPQRLLLELTETAAVSDLGDAQRFIDELQRAGCTLCLDDFGTGFASFAYLKHLQAQVLKIDGLFVRNLPREPDNQVFVRSIIEVAHGMGKRAVAECVEDEQTLELLRGFGVDMVQGYHLDRPQAAHPSLHRGGI